MTFNFHSISYVISTLSWRLNPTVLFVPIVLGYIHLVKSKRNSKCIKIIIISAALQSHCPQRERRRRWRDYMWYRIAWNTLLLENCRTQCTKEIFSLMYIYHKNVKVCKYSHEAQSLLIIGPNYYGVHYKTVKKHVFTITFSSYIFAHTLIRCKRSVYLLETYKSSGDPGM